MEISELDECTATRSIAALKTTHLCFWIYCMLQRQSLPSPHHRDVLQSMHVPAKERWIACDACLSTGQPGSPLQIWLITEFRLHKIQTLFAYMHVYIPWARVDGLHGKHSACARRVVTLIAPIAGCRDFSQPVLTLKCVLPRSRASFLSLFRKCPQSLSFLCYMAQLRQSLQPERLAVFGYLTLTCSHLCRPQRLSLAQSLSKTDVFECAYPPSQYSTYPPSQSAAGKDNGEVRGAPGWLSHGMFMPGV